MGWEVHILNFKALFIQGSRFEHGMATAPNSTLILLLLRQSPLWNKGNVFVTSSDYYKVGNPIWLSKAGSTLTWSTLHFLISPRVLHQIHEATWFMTHRTHKYLMLWFDVLIPFLFLGVEGSAMKLLLLLFFCTFVGLSSAAPLGFRDLLVNTRIPYVMKGGRWV